MCCVKTELNYDLGSRRWWFAQVESSRQIVRRPSRVLLSSGKDSLRRRNGTVVQEEQGTGRKTVRPTFCWPTSLYELVNNTTLVRNLFLAYLSISTCFGQIWAHHQEKQLCLCDTWYLLFCVDDWYVGAYASAYQTLCAHHQEKQLYLCDTWCNNCVYVILVIVILCGWLSGM